MLFAAPFIGRANSFAFNEAVYYATHNSYSGNLGGKHRGSFSEQFDSGVRFLELDIRNDDYAKNGDFVVGHMSAGGEVDHNGTNPDSNNLKDWLHVIRGWTSSHPDHVPVQVLS